MTPAKQAHAERMLRHLESTMTKPTPGPWTFGHRGNDLLWVGRDHEHTPVALIPWDEHPCALNNARENARLIAAAPDMLLALRCAQEALHGDAGLYEPDGKPGLYVFDIVTAAIAKAEGRSP
jgi:hypothetical protein